MRVYKTAEIRNVAVVGHGASGKTSLVDALAFVAGTSKRHGSVKEGTALTDYTPDEIERKYSINLALGVAEWMNTKINLIDTPGYLDFTGEALAGEIEIPGGVDRSEEHTSELQSLAYLVCRLLLEKKKKNQINLTLT